MKQREMITTDVLVIGAGLAGLRAAEMAKRYDLDVVIADKSSGRTNMSSASGGNVGISIVRGGPALADIPVGRHAGGPHKPTNLDDYLRRVWSYRSPYYKDQRMEEINALEGIPRQDEMAVFGVINPRNVSYYATPSSKGWGLTGPLYHYVQKVGCKLMKFFCMTDLLTVDDTVVGAVGFDVHNGDFIVVKAKAVVMATGGIANSWARNDATFRSTGDGHAIAYRNGLEMHNMEFEDQDAYIIAEKGLPQYLIPSSEGRSRAAVLNANGEDFLHNYIELGPGATLKPGDPFEIKYGVPSFIGAAHENSRAMAMEVYQGRGDEGAVLLDCRKVPDEVWLSHGSGISFLHYMRNFDYKKKPVHIFPGVIGSVGGIKTTEECETNLRGLFAVGEVGYSRFLWTCNVFGARAGRAAASYAMDGSFMEPDNVQVGEKKEYLEEFLSKPKSTDGNPKVIRKEIQDLSTDKFGILKTEKGLKEGLARFDELKKVASEKLYATDPRELRLAFEVDNMLVCQEMHAKAALIRTETRGPHNRVDYPYMDNDLWIKEIRIKKINGEMKLYTRPIRRGYLKIPKGRIPIKGMPQPE